MKPIPLLLALGTTLPVVAAPEAFAADAHASADTTLWTRKHLTGDWGGQRATVLFANYDRVASQRRQPP